MNYIDIIVLLIIVFTSVIGYMLGFKKAFSFLLKWVSSSMGAIFFYSHLKNILNSYFLIKDDLQNLIAFTCTFLIIYFLVSFLIYLVNRYYFTDKNLSYFNKISGMLSGTLIGFIVSFLLYTIISISLWQDGIASTQTAFVHTIFKPLNEISAPYFSTIFFSEKDKQRVAGVSESNFELNFSEEFRSTTFIEKPDLGNKLVELVNIERRVRNIKPLVQDSFLHIAANLHCTDLFTRGYFSHNNPEGLTPFNRLEQLNIPYKTAGENLAFSSTVLSAHKGLMNSPGHRANILNPKYGKIGISILQNTAGQLMVVQEFKN